MNRIFIILICGLLSMGAASRSFDGTNDEIDMGDVVNVTTGSVSSCSWSKLTEDAGADLILGKKNATGAATAGYMLRQNASDVIYAEAADATDQAICQAGSDLDGSWFFLCLIWDTSTFTVYGYANENLECSDVDTLVGSLSNTQSLQAGETGGDTDDFLGLLAYQTVSSGKVYTDWEMSQMRWLPGTIADSQSFFAPYWDGASPESDLSGNNFDGTVTGAAANTDGPPVMMGMAMPL
jgi:hypothetical protein